MKTTKRFLAVLMMAVMLFTMMPFTASAAPAYWGFDEYETIENPGAPEEITSYPTTVKKVSNSTYTMTSTIEGVGTISISLIEESWGTFNLGNWKLTTTSGTTHTFVDSSTDMEYVHQYYYSNSEVTWSGGNHGGEALESIKLYDGESGEEITLSVGQSKTVNVLHVIEKTNLLHFPDNNNDSINDYINKNTSYTEDQIYAKLTRKYTFTGPQIKLNVDYLYVKDSYHARNYSCMFPINKNYGYYCDMFDKDGALIKTIETRPYGDTSIADYAGPHNNGNEATRAVVYSEKYPNYVFDMRINTYKDTVNEFKNASYKTSFWDMNRSANKLYFTRFDEGQKIAHPTGTEVHTECIWLFTYDADGRQPGEGETPISRSKTYTNDVNTGDLEYNTSYGAKLTDGIASETFDTGNGVDDYGSLIDDSWYFFNGYSGANVTDGVGTIIIDLGAVYDISKVRAHLANNVSVMGTKAPSAITVSGSTENSAFETITTLSTKSDNDIVYWTSADAPENTLAQYIKFEFTLDGAGAYVNELEVYGSEPVEPEDPNLASGRDYTISVTNDPVIDSTYGTNYSANLTDGKAASEFNATTGDWFIFSGYKPNIENGKGTITIDFDKICNITKLKLSLCNNSGWGVNKPTKIEAYGSTDGKNYTLIGEMPTDSANGTGYWSELKVDNIQAGSVRFEITLNGSFALVNEVEVRGTETDTAYVPETETEHNHSYSDEWSNDETNHWHECSCGDKADIAEHDGEWTAVTEEELSKKICKVCGYVMDIEDVDINDPDFVLGDVNKSGEIDMMDYILLKRNYFGTFSFDEDQLKRGDCNKSDEIDMMDYILLKRAYFGTFVLE